MKFTIKRDFLDVLLARAMTISDSGALSAALKSVMIEVQGLETGEKLLNILRTDSILSTVIHTDKFTLDEDKEPYRVLVDAQPLRTLISNLENDMVSFDVSEHKLLISSGKFQAEWIPLPSKKFPELPRFLSLENTYVLDANLLVKTVERVRHAVSLDSVQSGLKQVFFDKEGVWAYNNDVYQQICVGLEDPPNFNIPAPALDVVKFIKLSGASTVSVQRTDDYCAFFVGNDIFLAKGLNAPPPIVGLLRKLNPKRQSEFLVEVDQIAKILKRVSITSNRRLIDIELKPAEMVVSAVDAFDNVSKESMSITYKGGAVVQKKFKINFQYLLDVFNSVGEKTAWVKVDVEHVIVEDKDSKAVIAMSQLKS